MTKLLNSASVGALVRETRVAAGLTQTQLAERIGASRFWVAAFERGKPGAELGLALKAIHALGLALHIAPEGKTSSEHETASRPSRAGDTTLADVVARATITHSAPSSVSDWPTTAAPHGTQPPTSRRREA